MRRAMLVAVISLTATRAWAAPPMAPATGAPAAAHADDRSKRWHATRVTNPPTIDGRLDDAAWRDVPAETRFTQNFPDEGQRPTQRTELRVAYDDEALYVAVRCYDDRPAEIVERLTRRDRDTDADKITIDISSKNDHTTAYHFGVNSAGVLLDGVRYNDSDYSGDWDGLWLGAAHRDAGGWSAEVSIPLKTLRYEGRSSEFGFQVRRYLQRRQEVDEWAFTPRSTNGEVSFYGTLDGLGGLKATRLFQIVPYLAGKVTTRYSQAPLDGTQFGGNVGADVKIGLTSALTLDLTFNPDFGQVDADQVVLNLSTFETFFPEKRPFFLEGVDVFATPIQLFYSRRIGQPPPEPSSDSVYSLAEPLPEGRIWAAAKLTGMVAPHLTVGVLDAVTDRAQLVVSRTGSPTTETQSTQPLTNYAVLRLKRDVLKNSSIGLIGTAVTRFENPGDAAPRPGDPCPDDDPPSLRGRCRHDAYAGGVDANLRTPDGVWSLTMAATGSVRVGGPHRTVVDGTELRPGSSGLGLFAIGAKNAGKLELWTIYEGYSPAYDINDAGFNQQSNLHRVASEGGFRLIRPRGIFQEGNIGTGLAFRSTWDGSAILQKQSYTFMWWRFRNFWQLNFEFDWDLDKQDVREAHDGAKVERSGGWTVYYNLRSDPRRRVTFGIKGTAARVRHGTTGDINGTLSLRPIPALELDILPHVGWSNGDPRWFDTVDHGNDMRSYYFGDLDSRAFDVTLRGTYTFKPTLTLQAYAQVFVAGGHYGQTFVADTRGARPDLPWTAFRPTARPPGLDNKDFREGNVNVNLVLRWEFEPGSTLLAVYTHASQQVDYDVAEGIGRVNFSRFAHGAGTDVFLLKLSILIN